MKLHHAKFLFRLDWPFFLASGGARMKLHEIKCHFHEVSHSGTEYRLRPRPYKILIYEDEHEDEDEMNQIRSHAFALRHFLFSAFQLPNS